MKEITRTINKEIAVLSESAKGYTKEVNLVSWNNGDPKIDIREWFPDHERCGKGITLTPEEGKLLLAALQEFFQNG